MVSLVFLTYHVYRTGRLVMGIRGRLVKLKGLVISDIVDVGYAVRHGMRTRANRGPVRVSRRRGEAAGEPSPGDASCVHQVADILPGHRHRGGGSGNAVIKGRLRIAHQRV